MFDRRFASLRLACIIVPGIVWLAFALAAPAHAALEYPLFVVYGPEASASEGDPDFQQLFFIMVPEAAKGRVELQVYDAAPGSPIDSSSGANPDAETRFALFPGETSALRVPGGSVPATQPLVDIRLAPDPTLDGNWHTIAEIDPARGVELGGKRLFQFLVEGIGTAARNRFDVRVVDPGTTERATEVELFVLDATLMTPEDNSFIEARFTVPEDSEALRIRNFDLRGGRIFYTGPHRSELLLSSGQGMWEVSEVPILPDEKGRLAAITIAGGVETPNDHSVQVAAVDPEGQEIPLPLDANIGILTPNERPEAGFAMRALDCARIEFDAREATDAENDPLSFHWVFPDGSESRDQKLVKAFPEPGIYRIRLEVSDTARQVGNGDALEIDIPVRPAPRIAIAQPAQQVAINEQIDFSLAQFTSDADIGEPWSADKVEWLFSDGTLLQGRSVKHGFSTPGRYTARVLARDASGHPCGMAAAQTQVLVNAPPKAEGGGDRRSIPGEEVIFDGSASSDADGEIASYRWTVRRALDEADAVEPLAVLSGIKTRFAFAEAGHYSVDLTVADSAAVANSRDTDRFFVTVNAPPVAKGEVPKAGLTGEQLVFDAGLSRDPDGSLSEIAWDFGDGTTITGPVARHRYYEPGEYTVTLTVTDNSELGNATNVSRYSIAVAPAPNQAPQPDAGPDIAAIAGETVLLDGSASQDIDGHILTYRWDLGDGSTASTPTVKHAYSIPGTYKVTLTTTDNSGDANGSESDQTLVFVRARPNAPPIAEAGEDRQLFVGEIASFDAGNSADPDGRILSYRWDFGDGSQVNGPNVVYAYPRPGIYKLALVVDDDTGRPDGRGEDIAVITVVPRANTAPVAEAGPDHLIAPGETVSFDASQSSDADGYLIGYDWDFGDGSTASGEKVIHRYDVPGTYPVHLRVQDNSGSPDGQHGDGATVVVNIGPRAIAGPDMVATPGETVTLDASASRDPDGELTDQKWSLFLAGTDTPMAEFDGAVASYSFERAGTYRAVHEVADTANVANSQDSDTLTIRVNAAPIANAGPDRTVLVGEPVSFDSGGSSDVDGKLVSYRWAFGDGASQTGPRSSYTYWKPGEYEVRLEVEDDSGLANARSYDTALVVVQPVMNERPTAMAGADRTVIVGEAVAFDATGSSDPDGALLAYRWNFGDGTTGNRAKTEHAYWKAGTYTVELTVLDDSGDPEIGQDTDRLTVTVGYPPNEKPVANAGDDREVQVGEPVTFDGSLSHDPDGRLLAYRWDLGDGNKVDGISIVHAYQRAGTYEVTLTVVDDAPDEPKQAADTITVNATALSAESGAAQ